MEREEPDECISVSGFSKEASHEHTTSSDDMCTKVQCCTGNVKLDKSPPERTMHYGSDVSPRTTKASLCTVISETGKDVSALCDNTEIASCSLSGLLLESNEGVSSAVCVTESEDGISSVTEREYNFSDPVDRENSTEMTKMASEATDRPDPAHSASAAAIEHKVNTSQEKLPKLQRKDADDPDTLLMDVKKEKDIESVGSPGTPLLDEQPYSPSLNVPDTGRKDVSKKGETEAKNEFDDSVQAAKNVVTQSPHPLSEMAVTCSSVSNHPTPPLVTKDDIRSETQDILIDCKKTSGTAGSGIINSSPLTVPDCSKETGIVKCEPSENKVQESGDSSLCSGSGINSQNTDFVITSQTTEFSSQRTLALHAVVKECVPSSQDIVTVTAKEDEKVGTALSSTEFTNDKRNLNDVDALKQANCEMKCKDAENCKDTESSSKNVHRRHSSSSNSSSRRRRRSESGHRSSKIKSDHREKLETNSADSSSRDRRNSDTKEACRKERSHSSSSSDRKRHCSRCYKRSKIKRASIGVQCRRDKTIDKYVKHGYPDSSSRGGVLKIDYQTKHFSLPRPLPYTQPCLEQLKFGRFIRIETYANGGATVVHMYQDEIDCLNKEEMEELVQEYFKVRVQYTPYFFVTVLLSLYFSLSCKSQ